MASRPLFCSVLEWEKTHSLWYIVYWPAGQFFANIVHCVHFLTFLTAFSVQVRCLGTTTRPSSQAVRWWTSAATSLSSTSARRLWAARGRSRMMPSGNLSRRRPARPHSSFRAVQGHKWTPFPTTPCRRKPCQSRKWWNSDRWKSERLPVAVSQHSDRLLATSYMMLKSELYSSCCVSHFLAPCFILNNRKREKLSAIVAFLTRTWKEKL